MLQYRKRLEDASSWTYHTIQAEIEDRCDSFRTFNSWEIRFFRSLDLPRFDAHNCVPLAFVRETLYSFAARRLLMASVLKKRRKKMRKHKYKKLRRRLKFLRRKG